MPVNEAQQTLPDLIDAVSQSHQPVVIAGKNGNAVLLSESDWSAI
jgi:antitoxin YefM